MGWWARGNVFACVHPRTSPTSSVWWCVVVQSFVIRHQQKQQKAAAADNKSMSRVERAARRWQHAVGHTLRHATPRRGMVMVKVTEPPLPCPASSLPLHLGPYLSINLTFLLATP